jgi:hypothetical protein
MTGSEQVLINGWCQVPSHSLGTLFVRAVTGTSTPVPVMAPASTTWTTGSTARIAR